MAYVAFWLEIRTGIRVHIFYQDCCDIYLMPNYDPLSFKPLTSRNVAREANANAHHLKNVLKLLEWHSEQIKLTDIGGSGECWRWERICWNETHTEYRDTLSTPCTEYTECQAFSPVVWTDSPRHLTCKRVLLPPLVQKDTLTGEWGGGRSQFGRRDRHSGTPCIQ